MNDLLSLLGDEWDRPTPIDDGLDADSLGESTSRGECSHSHDERTRVTHGCRESMRPTLHWTDVGAGGYVDGMGRPAHCRYCFSCMGTGTTHVYDPWTRRPPRPYYGEVTAWHGAPCHACGGSGWTAHRYDCDGSEERVARPVAAFGWALGWGAVTEDELLVKAVA